MVAAARRSAKAHRDWRGERPVPRRSGNSADRTGRTVRRTFQPGSHRIRPARPGRPGPGPSEIDVGYLKESNPSVEGPRRDAGAPAGFGNRPGQTSRRHRSSTCRLGRKYSEGGEGGQGRSGDDDGCHRNLAVENEGRSAVILGGTGLVHGSGARLGQQAVRNQLMRASPKAVSNRCWTPGGTPMIVCAPASDGFAGRALQRLVDRRMVSGRYRGDRDSKTLPMTATSRVPPAFRVESLTAEPRQVSAGGQHPEDKSCRRWRATDPAASARW